MKQFNFIEKNMQEAIEWFFDDVSLRYKVLREAREENVEFHSFSVEVFSTKDMETLYNFYKKKYNK